MMTSQQNQQNSREAMRSSVQLCASAIRTATRQTASRNTRFWLRVATALFTIGSVFGCSDGRSDSPGPRSTGGATASGGSGGSSGAPDPTEGGSAGGGAVPADTPIPEVVRGDEICGRAPGGSYTKDQVLRFENPEAGLAVQIGRMFVRPGTGLSTIYEVAEFSLVREGKEFCTGKAGRITETSYQNTHHNWEDYATAKIDDTVYKLYLGRDLAEPTVRWAPTLSATHAITGDVLLEPTPLVATGGPVLCWECPSHVDVIISEVMANNSSTFADEHGEYEPWIELYNPSGSAIPLAGWTLSNDLSNRALWTFPDITIPRHGYLLLFADGQSEQGDLHTNFRLSPERDAVILTAPSGVTNGGRAFGPQQPDRSFGYTFSAGTYVWMGAATPGTANPGLE